MEQVVVSLELDLGLFELRLGLKLARLGRFVVRLALVAGGYIGVGLDFDQQVALFDPLPLLDRHGDNLAAFLGIDDDFGHGLELAGAGDGFDDDPAGHFLGLDDQGDFPLVVVGRDAQPRQAKAQQGEHDNFSVFTGLFGCHLNLSRTA